MPKWIYVEIYFYKVKKKMAITDIKTEASK